MLAMLVLRSIRPIESSFIASKLGSHREQIQTHKQKRPDRFPGQGVSLSMNRYYAAIDNLSLFIALFSS
ncbi:hypothetical protein QCD79_24975 [Pseudomonas quasicaspiana]|nr:hypothetical protein [Pseudomonas quasicaspiana]